MFNKYKAGCFVHEQDSISSIIVFCSIKKSIGHEKLKIIIAQDGKQRTNYHFYVPYCFKVYKALHRVYNKILCT